MTLKPGRAHSATSSKQIHKSAQPSKTLMRYAVKKPSAAADQKTVGMDVVTPAPGQTATTVFHSVSKERGKRAEAIRQNSLVNRFGGELREAPANLKPALTSKPERAEAPAQEPVFTPQRDALGQSKAKSMLDKGLMSANSHEAKVDKKAKLHHRVGRKLGLSKKAASIATASLTALIVGGFFIYQNIPNISVHYASAKAGIHASLPNYQPSGFTINSHVAYSPGEISVAYKANADSRAYTITQKSTNWNSDALKEHLMGAKGVIPQSYPDNGRTIYLHDNQEADWVNNGVWYSISGNSSLNTDQLIKIATSL